MPRRSSRLVAVLTAALILAACDIGDGTTLRDPVAPTTLPPPDTTPLETLPLDDPAFVDTALDEAPVIDSVPLETIPQGENGTATGFGAFAPWAEGAPIDVLYTCDGANASPAFSWTGVPDGTQELAISLVDETNLSNGRPFIHWVLTGIDPVIDRVGENETPPGAVRGLNFFGDVGYTGPCPDPGSTSTFTLTVFALNQQVELADGTPAAELLDVVRTVSIDSASTSGTVTR
ncbi:MAG: YbhB/YbcL family Raf kinase inhibitor-like protein [Ilumatobacter sp.]|uniref:YbhB/YbcL family Raf kinase inhibitor-like protein n=1 Tax=Ilumatobacter sp. TaxID=1967498 RepID=UPI003C762964